jgi:hypothetical protein
LFCAIEASHPITGVFLVEILSQMKDNQISDNLNRTLSRHQIGLDGFPLVDKLGAFNMHNTRILFRDLSLSSEGKSMSGCFVSGFASPSTLSHTSRSSSQIKTPESMPNSDTQIEDPHTAGFNMLPDFNLGLSAQTFDMELFASRRSY